MTLDEAIRHCEEVAEEKEQEAKEAHVLSGMDCMECAEEHRQLAEWLKELKTYQEGINEIKNKINNFKGCDMWDTANGMEFALELLGVENAE